MFTGIIETLGIVRGINHDQGNITFTIESSLSPELSVDQSVAHNGVCLTVIDVQETMYKVTAIAETLTKSNLADLRLGDTVNLERAMILGTRLDGHIVQGHVDQVGICTGIESANGSWIFTFSYTENQSNVTVEKGSITVNGVSLTVLNSAKGTFSVAIIPYTFEHTNFNTLQIGNKINLEFDIIGKYVARLLKR
ncbi:riboflavin synthase [Flavobacteriaceae bacterium F08102]|nr:riboflavin synthase [Flavobacteriaceae bacterium F08102]